MALAKTEEELLKIERPGYRLRLWLENDKMECRGDLEIVQSQGVAADVAEDEENGSQNHPPALDSDTSDVLTPAELIRLLHQCDITETINADNLNSFCLAAAEGGNQQRVLLAEGNAPEHGKDGWFEMEVKTPGNQPDYKEDEKGTIDLRTLNTCTEIKPEMRLGRVHFPTGGIAGVTANGLPIPAEGGKPFGLIAGAGVVLKFSDRVAFATRAGRALLNKKTLSVVNELVISGDLDLKVGNIDFHGFVEIKGDVPDDYKVKASKGLRIGGAVGASRIESGGSLEIGSMAGKEVGQIICQGDLKANFLNQASVTCHGNVFVSREIRNSEVKSAGTVVVERGAIIGGKCVALEGIEAKVLGATSCVQTSLMAGVYFPDDERFDYLQQQLADIDSQLKKIGEALGPLGLLNEKNEALAIASELRVSILNEQWEELEQTKEQILSEMEASTPQVLSRRNPKINALTAIHEGVLVCLGQSVEKFQVQKPGPLSLIENTRQGGLRVLSLTPLSKQAVAIEEEIFQDEQEVEQGDMTALEAD